jgi:excisionase family DNA binding protein
MSERKPGDDYTLQEAAQKLRHSPRTLRRWIKRGLLKKSGSSRKILLSAKSVDSFVETTA